MWTANEFFGKLCFVKRDVFLEGHDMAIKGLTIIGERINPGFKSTKAMFDNEDIKAIQDLAVSQAEKGAVCLNINVGERALTDSAWMVEVIQAVQAVVNVPLSFDFPNVAVQEVCLKAYDLEKAQGQKPIVNSISELRWEMLDLLKIRPFKLILMASERLEDGAPVPNKFSVEVEETAKRMVMKIVNGDYGLTLDDIYIDVSIGPLGADMEGLTKMAVDGIKKVGADPELKGVHMSVGLSNFSIMLPKLATDGGLLKSRVESAFLTLTVPHGLDTIIGTAGRDYQMLPADEFVMQGVREAIEMTDVDALMRVQEMYNGDS